MSAVQADPQQPDVEFAFGLQPAFTRGLDEGKKIGVVGANDVWIKFIAPQLMQRGATLYITDLNPARAEAARKKAEEAGCTAHVVASIAEMPDDLHGIYLLTPPSSHLALVKEAAKKGAPIALEKPFTGNLEDMVALESFVKQNNVPLYGIDWALLNAQPLFHAVGMNVPFPEALDIQNAEAFKTFDFANIVKIDARDIEGGGNSLGDPAALAASRPWMMNFRTGGGVLYDMTIHLTNVLAEMGFTNTGIQDVLLGTLTNESGEYHPGVYPQGVYRHFADDTTGDIYARTHMQTGVAGGNQTIETVLESGKNAQYNDQFIELTDGNGNVLHWEIIPKDSAGNRIPGSRLEMWNAANPDQVIASIGMTTDCYALAAEQFDRYATQYKQGQKPPAEPSHFAAHRDGIYWVAAMHQVARAQNLPADATVEQLGILEDKGAVARPAWRRRDESFKPLPK